jgi:hypothetical protein
MADESSLQQSNQSSANQRELVVRTIMSMLANAEADADRVAALLKGRGRKIPGKTATEPKSVHPAAREALLLLAAAIRLRQWERAGLTTRLPDSLPSAADALDAIGEVAHQSPPSSIPLQVFKNWHQFFAETAPAELRADVLVEPINGAALIEDLAAFLWRARRVNESK